MMKYCVLVLILFLAACSNNEKTVQPSSHQEPTREELKDAMKYHGVQYAEEGDNGEWYFYRNGKRCRLFSYLEHSKQHHQQ